MPSPLIFALQSITIFWILMLNMIFFTYYNLVGFHFCGWVCHAHLSHELASGTALDLVRYGICSISMASVGSMMLTRKKCELAMTFSGSPFGFYKSVNSFLFHMALENPSSSYAWEMPQMKRFISHFSPKFAWLDFCQYGEDWKKPTTIMGKLLVH